MKQAMQQTELIGLLDWHVGQAEQNNQSAADKRRKIWDYYEGRPFGDEEAGKSQVVTSDVADAVEWIMPSLMRIFTGSSRVVDYLPVTADDEALAEQASDYINHVFMVDNPGYLILHNWIKAALMEPVSVVKYWWQEDRRAVTESYEALDDDQLTFLLRDPYLEVVEHTQYEAPVPAVTPGAVLHNVKVRRWSDQSGLRIETLPAEEFLISPDARSVDDADFVAHRRMMTRSDLVGRGVPFDLVQNLPVTGSAELHAHERPSEGLFTVGDTPDKAMEKVTVYECYLKADLDGDGQAERHRFLVAGETPGLMVLEQSEVNHVPFAALSSILMPHRFAGRSVAETVMDIQRIKSALMRQMLDNLYRTNNPREEVVEDWIVNPEEILEDRIGAKIRVSQPGAIRELSVPFVAQQAFPMLNYLDGIGEKRTGINQASTGMDPLVLQNQSATAFQGMQAAAQSKIEMIARVFAETGFKDLFRGLLQLTVEHQDRARIIRLRNEWVPIEPSRWNIQMDAMVNVGLGAGNRDRDLQTLTMIAAKQEQVIGSYGPDNGMVSLPQLANTYRKMIEAAGLKGVDAYVSVPVPQPQPAPVPPEQMPPPPPPVDPLALEFELKQQEAAARIGLEREKMTADMALDQQKFAARVELDREKLRLEHERKLMEIGAEANLETERMKHQCMDGQGNLAVKEQE